MTETYGKRGSLESQNNKTSSLPEKRSRGRPKGSKNKSKLLAVTPASSIEVASVLQAKKGRGRPKGAKNKPKHPHQEVVEVKIKAGKRGRPKGAKNKPKTPVLDEPLPVVEVKKRNAAKKDTIAQPAVAQVTQKDNLEEHPLYHAVKWLEKNTHSTELQYYRSRASRLGVALHIAMMADILGFFNVQGSDLCKQIKKNNFIVKSSNGLPN